MVKRFLITTALEETWVSNEPVLFLGEWCKRYGRKGLWSNMDAEVMPYHWDDRSKLHADYQYLKEFHERLLQDLTPQLNKIHDVDRSLRYWRILIGPWLGWFVQALFDRWTSIQRSISHCEISGTIVMTGWEDSFVPHDHDDFVNRFAFEDEWNHYIYSKILQKYTKVNCVERLRQKNIYTDVKPISITVKNDPRVLPIGRLLRKTKINELPQLINIFKGDMSVIGPRPQTQRCFDAFPLTLQTKIIKVRPGLSGIGSIIFRNEENMIHTDNNPDKFYDDVVMPYKGSLEEWYVSRQTISNYFILICLTIWVIVSQNSDVIWKLFKDLPNPPEELKSWI